MHERNHPVGMELLTDPALNKSTAFTEEERDRFRLGGLLPAAIDTQELQQQRVMENLHRKAHDIERYIFLMALMARNERLFYRTALDHIEEVLPLVYTPTVGQACKEFAHIYRQPRGLFLTLGDRGQVRRTLDNWPSKDVRVIVVTDGERILGLGDLGANGMGIPLGKLALYTTCAGIQPSQCLPVTLDVGTNNKELLEDPLYIGVRAERVGGEPYFELVEEFVEAVQEKFPNALIQFEDFLTPNAYGLLSEYRDRVLCFNDDIQGTAAVALAGIQASTRISGLEFKDLRVLFLGAGSAATGIGELLVDALVAQGLDEGEARSRVWFVDSGGLVVQSREHLAAHKLPFAHDHPPADFMQALRSLRPQVLIGATGHPGTFQREAIELLSELNPRPTIFALSNPTSRAECTAEQAYEWSDGRAIFASGSPSAEVEYGGQRFRPGQGNNVYIFPGVGLAAVTCKARRITEEVFLTAARVLAEQVSEEDLAAGAIYPSLTRIREVSLSIAEAVVREIQGQGLAREPIEGDIREALAREMYDPTY